MKKFCSVILAVFIVSTCAVALAACKEEPKEKHLIEFYLPTFFNNHPPIYIGPYGNFNIQIAHNQKISPPNIYSISSSDAYKELLVKATFIGWFQEEGCINSWKLYETPVTCDMKLYAKFVPNWEY